MKTIKCELNENEVRTIWAALTGLQDLFSTNIQQCKVTSEEWFNAVDAYHAVTKVANRFTELRENFND